MSGQIGGQTKALPFTGLASLPILVIGIVLSVTGVLLTQFRRLRSGSRG